MSTETLKVIGTGLNRVEGRAKVTGRANYAADNHAAGLVHAYGVVSTIGAGRIESMDLAAAQNAPGVLAILHHRNMPKLYRSPNEFENGTRVGEVRIPFEDETIYYAGQFVALVVAETFEQARAAARLVRVTYRPEKPKLNYFTEERPGDAKESKEHPGYQRGQPDEAWVSAPVKVEAMYSLPVEVHNPMEIHASTARWEDGRLEIHESTQWVVGQHKALAQVLGISPQDVTVHAPFIGGGFGGKLFMWPHTVLAAVAAREVQRPVKFMLERKNEFTTVGHRPPTKQLMRVGASADGKLVALRHDTWCQTSKVQEFMDSVGDVSGVLYDCPNVAITQRVVGGSVGTPTPMRAPGAASGMVGLEGAMDEMAVALKLDPIEFRLRNLAAMDPTEKLPWSGNHVRECIELAAKKFGWDRRDPAVGSMREGDEILGWGFALATWTAERSNATARVELRADGTVRVACATQDIGTGTYTVIAQAAAEATGVPVERIEVEIGRSGLPEGPISGGSMATATVIPAVLAATKKAVAALAKLATQADGVFAGSDPKALTLAEGALHDQRSGRSVPLAATLAPTRVASVSGEAKSAPGPERKKFSFRSFGAHCLEVRWDPGIAKLRVSRVVTVIDAGRIINRKTAANQIYGGIMMGLGMGRLEESVYDLRNGRVLTDNIADYLMPVHADTPDLDVTFIEHPDEHMGGFGARGVGEIGVTGVAPALISAVYHATGKRVRDLPVTIEKLLA